MPERKVQILSGFDSQLVPALTIYVPGMMNLSTLIPGYIWTGQIDSLLLLGNTKVNLRFDVAFQDEDLTSYVLRKDVVLPAGNQAIDLVEKAFSGNRLAVGAETALIITMTNPQIFNPTRDTITITGSATETGFLQGDPRILPVEEGGTGVAAFPANSLFVSDASGNLSFLAPGADGQVLKSMGGLWTVATP